MGASSSAQSDQISIAVVSPASGESVQGTVPVSVQVNASSTVTSVELSMDTAPVGSWSTASVQTTISPGAGAHQLTVLAKDAAGNSAQKSVSFSVMGGNLFVWPADGATVPSPVFVSANFADQNSGPSLSLAADGTRLASANGNSLQSYVALSPGPHQLTVTGSDKAGRRQQSVVSITVPFPRYALVMNDDATISSFAFDMTSGQLVPQGYLALSQPGSSMADGGMVQGGAGNLEGFANADGALATMRIEENSWSPKLANAAVAASPGALLSSVRYESAAGAKWVRGFSFDSNNDVWKELPSSPFAAVGGSSSPVPSKMAFTPNGRFAYLANPASRSVEVFAVDHAGNLQSRGLISASITAAYATMDPHGQLLYVTSADSGDLAIFHVDQNTGKLTLASGSPFAVSQNAAPKLVTTGRFVYVADQGQNPITIYRADLASGALQQTGQTASSYRLLAADPSGHFLFAAVQNDFSGEKQNLLITLAISQTNGSLTELNSVRLRGAELPTEMVAGWGARPVSWKTANVYIGFEGDSGAPGELVQYSADPNHGTLAAVNSFVMPADETPVAIAPLASRNTIFVQATNSTTGQGNFWSPAQSNPAVAMPSAERLGLATTSGNIYFRGCSACASGEWNVGYWSGAPASAAHYSAESLTGLHTLASDPLEQFLFSSIDENGAVFNKSFLLDAHTGAPTLANVDWITFDPAYAQAVDPSGKTELSIDPGNGNVAVSYRIETDGNMDWMQVSSFSGTRVIIDPQGRYAVGVNAAAALDPEMGPGQIYVYQLTSDGGLVSVAGPYSTPFTPRDIAMDASGKFLYIVNGGSLSIFSFSEQTGTLSEVPSSPFTIAPSGTARATAIAIVNQKQ